MANEKRMIDANDVIRNLRKELDEMEPVDFWDDALATYKKRIIPRLIFNVITYIERQPTVDAVEVVHGRWEDMYGGHYVNPRFRCSVCNEKALYKFVRDMLGNYKEVQELTPYCPYCMAKMDSDGNACSA